MTLEPAARVAVLTEKQIRDIVHDARSEPLVSHPAVPAKASPAKPGIMTTEFWVSTLTTVGAIAFAVQGSLPPRYAAYAALASTIAYSISRGLAKS